jgi:hypothetical protein
VGKGLGVGRFGERKPDLGEDGKYVNPSWQEIEWDVDQLRQVLRCHVYPKQLVDQVTVNQGDTPRAVLYRADKARGGLERFEPAKIVLAPAIS